MALMTFLKSTQPFWSFTGRRKGLPWGHLEDIIKSHWKNIANTTIENVQFFFKLLAGQQ